MIPETRYARTIDGIHVAYQVIGEGHPIDLVWAPPMGSHLILGWEWRPWVEFMHGLARFCRLIRFDKRGTGLSDRVPRIATLEERADDIRAVMDAVGSEQAAIFGISEGGSMACFFAAAYPERTRSLILLGVQARWVKTEDYPWGITPEENERMIAELAEHGPSDEYLFGTNADMLKSTDPSYYEFFKRYAQASASPSAYEALQRMNREIDVQDILPTISVPTLVMNRAADQIASVDAARDLAARIRKAKFVELPGPGHGIFTLDGTVLAEIEEFITGIRPQPVEDRLLATILFTDIVGSTEWAARIGDAEWKRLLLAHHDSLRRSLARFRGREVDTAGDSFLATFDGPGRAVQCGRSIVADLRKLGLDVRVGLHVGECELIGEKVAGIAVHTAARVVSLAGPGDVLVTGTVKDLTAGSGIEFEDRGVHQLKGVPGEWHLYSVTRA